MKMMMLTAISFLCVGALSASADPAPNQGPVQMKKEGTGCTVALPILVPFASICAQTSAYNALAKSCQKKLDGQFKFQPKSRPDSVGDPESECEQFDF
jgi:hypothetical protein